MHESESLCVCMRVLVYVHAVLDISDPEATNPDHDFVSTRHRVINCLVGTKSWYLVLGTGMSTGTVCMCVARENFSGAGP